MTDNFAPHPLWKSNHELAQKIRDKVMECHEKGFGNYNLGGIEMGNRGLEFLAHEMSELDDVKILSLSSIGASDEGIKHIVTIAQNSPRFQQLGLENNAITHMGLSTLAEGLAEVPQLTHVDVRANPLGKKAGESLAIIAAKPSVRTLIANDCNLGDEGMRPISAVIARSHTLEAVHLGGNDVSLAGCEEYMRALRKNRSLTKSGFQQSEDKDDPRKEFLTKAYAEVRNPNLTMMLPIDQNNRPRLNQNQADIKGLPPHLAGDLKDIDHATLKFIDARANGIFTLGGEFLIPDSRETRRETYLRYETFMRGLPRLPDPSEKDYVKALFTEDENGFTALDNPRINRTGDALLQVLEAHNIPLTDNLLTRSTRRGGSVLEALAGAMETETLVTTLNQQGIKLGASALLSSNGLPTETFHNIIEQDSGAALFTPNNWIGKSRAEMMQVYDKLPASQKSEVGLQTLQQQMRSKSQQGLGR